MCAPGSKFWRRTLRAVTRAIVFAYFAFLWVRSLWSATAVGLLHQDAISYAGFLQLGETPQKWYASQEATESINSLQVYVGALVAHDLEHGTGTTYLETALGLLAPVEPQQTDPALYTRSRINTLPTLGVLGIRDGDTLWLSTRLRGGAPKVLLKLVHAKVRIGTKLKTLAATKRLRAKPLLYAS